MLTSRTKCVCVWQVPQSDIACMLLSDAPSRLYFQDNGELVVVSSDCTKLASSGSPLSMDMEPPCAAPIPGKATPQAVMQQLRMNVLVLRLRLGCRVLHAGTTTA